MDVTLKPSFFDEAMAEPEVEGVSQSIKYIVSQFLEDKHYHMLHQELAKKWSKLNALSAAVQLMEHHGVVIPKDKLEHMQTLPEEQQINEMVKLMPQKTTEEFQHFFLQLQLLVSTVARVRRNIEDGMPEEVERALNDADSTGISSFILRMCIVQAGVEVQSLRAQYEAWVRDTDVKLGRLISAQADSITAFRKLAEAQAKLVGFRGGQNSKIQKVLLSFSASSDSALRGTFFGIWRQYTANMRFEGAIREEYAERIDRAQHRLTQFKTSRKAGVKGMMDRVGEDLNYELLSDVFRIWHHTHMQERDAREHAGVTEALNAKLQAMTNTQAETSLKVMSRVVAGNNASLMRMTFATWSTSVQEAKQTRLMDATVAEAKEKMETFIQKRSQGARRLLSSVCGAFESGGLHVAFSSWKELVQETKREREVQKSLEEVAVQLDNFKSAGKASAMYISEKAGMHQDQVVQLQIFCAWQLHTRVEQMLHVHHARIDAKRQQLVSVQTMFRTFAVQLESGLKEDDTVRDHAPFAIRAGLRRSFSKNDGGSFSLPDIHSKAPSPKTSSGTRQRQPSTPDSQQYQQQYQKSHPPRQAW